MVCAIVVFAIPTRQPVFGVWRPSTWSRHASRHVVVLAVLGGVAVAMWLFTWRTWYYTGFLDMFYGTQAADRAVWKAGEPVLHGVGHVISSVMMVITMNDPPAFDVRSLPIIGGLLAALGGAARRWSVARAAAECVGARARRPDRRHRRTRQRLPRAVLVAPDSGRRGDLRVRAVVGGYRHSDQIAATRSPIASDDVRPGESIPEAWITRGLTVSRWTRKSANPRSGPCNLARMPLPPG